MPPSPNIAPGKMTLMIDPPHIWNVIYNARSNRHHPPTSPILRLPRQIAFKNLREICRKRLKCQLQCVADPTMIRAWTRHLASHARSPRPLYAPVTHFVWNIATFCAPMLRRRPKVTLRHHRIKCCSGHKKRPCKTTKRCDCPMTLQLHQILRLPRKMTVMIWRHLPESQSAAPAMPTEGCQPCRLNLLCDIGARLCSKRFELDFCATLEQDQPWWHKRVSFYLVAQRNAASCAEQETSTKWN